MAREQVAVVCEWYDFTGLLSLLITGLSSCALLPATQNRQVGPPIPIVA